MLPPPGNTNTSSGIMGVSDPPEPVLKYHSCSAYVTTALGNGCWCHGPVFYSENNSYRLKCVHKKAETHVCIHV